MTFVFLSYTLEIVNHLLTPPLVQNGDTAIAMASSFGHLNIVRFLIGRGADVNSKDKVCSLFGAVTLNFDGLTAFVAFYRKESRR